MTTKEIFQIDTYRNSIAPKAATFGVGARDLTDIQHAIDARRALSQRQSIASSTPEGDRNDK